MTTGQTHGHEIIAIVGESPGGISADALAGRADRDFGADARFSTCSAEGLSLGELLAFLVERDKVRMRDGLIFAGGSPACDHD